MYVKLSYFCQTCLCGHANKLIKKFRMNELTNEDTEE